MIAANTSGFLVRRSRETQREKSSLDSGVGVRGSPCLANPPGSCEFDLFCFHKTHLTRWMPVLEGKKKMGEGLCVGVEAGKKIGLGGKKVGGGNW